MSETKTYGIINPELREQSFVPRYDEPAQWAYCCKRFTAFWREHKCPNRRVPKQYFDKDHDGKAGWFFPAKWLRDFAYLPQQRKDAA